MIPSMVQYVNLVVDHKDSAKGQALANGMMTLGAVFANFIGGSLLDILSVKSTLLIAAGCGLPGRPGLHVRRGAEESMSL